jgi:CubicO group peptidase (beta-lactamase class C family)
MQFKEFDDKLTAYIEENNTFGVLQIMKGDKVIYKKHFGYENYEEGKAIDDDTTYRYYSMTKPFTATCIMLLYEEGKISLEDRVCDILPSAKELCPDITVKNLLQHTSGLPELESFGSPLLDDGRVSFEKEVEWLVRQPLDFSVGTQSYYRNTNYSLLSLIVEHLWDIPFEQCLKKRVFEPLAMDTMACEYNEKKVPLRAYGYELKDGKICRAPYGNMNIMYGGGFTVGKLADMTKFYRAIREKKLLKPETWELVFTRADVGVFGLGCYVIKDVGLTCYQHTGGSAGFRNMHRYYPDPDLDFIFLSNSGFGDAREHIAKMVSEYFLSDRHGETEKHEMDKGFV